MPTLSIPRDYNDLSVLTEAQLDSAFDAIETAANTTLWGSDNLAANSVTSTQITAGNVTLAKLASAVAAALVPSGAVLAFGGTSAPTGYLLCDGSAVNRTTYADLFTAIGVAHGSGDGATTFNLPDYRGRFLRGRDAGQGRDPDAADRTAMASGGNTGDNVGSVQTGQYASHNHGGGSYATSTHKHLLPFGNAGGTSEFMTDPANGTWAYGDDGGTVVNGGSLGNYTASVSNTSKRAKSDVPDATGSIASNGGNETRPLNANVNYIIKT